MNILITGGSGKLGREICLSLAGDGASLAIIYNRSKKETEIIAEEVESLGGSARIFKADISDTKQIKKAVAEAADVLGGTDTLVNCAAIFARTPLGSVKEDDWNDLMNVNARASYFFAKYATPHLKKAEPGRIINIADTYGASPSAGFVLYGVSKAAVIAMTKGLAKELAPDILVNCVCPGVVETTDHRPQTRDQKAVNASLLKKPVEMKDVVSAVMFLAKNNSMTGQSIFVDGGRYV